MKCILCDQSDLCDDVKEQLRLILNHYLNKPLVGSTQFAKKRSLLANSIDEAKVLLIQKLLSENQLGLPAKNKSIDRIAICETLGLSSKLDKNPQSTQQRSLRAFFEAVREYNDANIDLCCCLKNRANIAKIRAFKHEAELRLSGAIKRKIKEIPELDDLTIEADIVKGNKKLRICAHFSLIQDPMIETLTGKDAIDNALDCIQKISLPTFDVEGLDSPGKVANFIKNDVNQTLEKFRDSGDIEQIIVYTADKFKWDQRVFFKQKFKQKDRYLFDVKLNSGEIIRNTLKGFANSKKEFLRHMQPDTARIVRDIMTVTDGRLQAKPIQNVSVNYDDSRGHTRVNAEIKYQDGEIEVLKYIGNTKKVKGKNDVPILRINRTASVDVVRTNSTHLIFYVWSSDERVKGRRRTLFKFGLTRLKIIGTYSNEDIEQAVRKRMRSYNQQHKLNTTNSEIEILSTVEPIGSRGEKSLIDFETYLKNRENNKMLYVANALDVAKSYSSNPTELMFSEKDENVIDYILKLAVAFSKSFKLREVYIDDDGAETRSLPSL